MLRQRAGFVEKGLGLAWLLRFGAQQCKVRERREAGRLALAELGVIPKEAAKTIWAKGKDATFDVARIDEIERETKHDVIAFLTHLAEIVGPEARFVHQGMTSSDVLDTCLNVQLTRAADILIADLDALLAALDQGAGLILLAGDVLPDREVFTAGMRRLLDPARAAREDGGRSPERQR